MGRLSVLNKLVFVLNVLVALLLLLACIASFITWELFSFLSFLSLVVPYLMLANIIFSLYWLFKGKRQWLMSFFTLLLGYVALGTFIKFFDSNEKVEDNDFSIMTFNSHGAMGDGWSKYPSYGDEIAEFIAAENPDIVCFQEFGRILDKELKQYSYKYQTPFRTHKTRQAIYSKYRIIDSGSLNFPGSFNNALYADILIHGDTIRVYNVHLQSLLVRAGSFKREEPQRLFKRLDKLFLKQYEQAKLIQAHSEEVVSRKIICGDFNNTQFSRVYNTIKGDMNDSFQEKGYGFGNTYMFKFLPFRIDFILADPEIGIKSHKNFDARLSDHEPVMASFRLVE